MPIVVDARGLLCPQPVIAAKKALDGIAEGNITVIVDNSAARENVAKLAASLNCRVNITEAQGHYYLAIVKGDGAAVQSGSLQAATDSEVVYLVSKNTLGHGNEELGGVLMKSLMYTLTETTPAPKTMMFINSGVLLSTEGSPVLEHLKRLEQAGVRVLSCGTCLDYYQLKDKLAVGSVTNMYTILAELSGAGKAITL